MVADDIVVVLEVSQHLFVVSFAVTEAEPVFDFDRVAGPVQRRRLAKQRASAAVEQAANDLVLGVVVRRARVLVHVEPGEPPNAPLEGRVFGVGKPAQVEQSEPFAVVLPVEHDREFLVVHPVPGKRHLDRLGLRVLPEVAFPRLLVHLEHDVRSPERMQHRPTGTVLGRIVRPVIAAPPLDTSQIAAFVKVSRKERLARLRVGPEQFPLEQRPIRRRHRRGDVNRNVARGRLATRQQANERNQHRTQMASHS